MLVLIIIINTVGMLKDIRSCTPDKYDVIVLSIVYWLLQWLYVITIL